MHAVVDSSTLFKAKCETYQKKKEVHIYFINTSCAMFTMLSLFYFAFQYSFFELLVRNGSVFFLLFIFSYLYIYCILVIHFFLKDRLTFYKTPMFQIPKSYLMQYE
jgi:hypothetical protein